MGSWIGAIDYYNILQDWKNECGIKTLMVKSEYLEGDYLSKRLVVYSESPGALIGKAGERIDRYKKLLQERDSRIKEVKLVEVDLIVEGTLKVDIESEKGDYFRSRGL